QGKRHIAPVSSFPFEYLGKQQEYYNEELIDGFIDDATTKNEPFCLFFCSHNSHTPWNQGDTSLFDKDKITLPPYLVDTDVTRESYVKYLAEINALDDEVGKLLAVLDRYDIVDNTIVLFTSEQGHSFPFAKWTCYGSGLRTAVIMRYPDVIKAGVETDAMCEYVDVVPTLIDLVGGEVPTDIDGKSFIKVVKGKTDRHKKYTFSQHTTCGINSGSDYYGIRSVYDGEYRYVLNLTPEVKFCNILTADRKEDSIFASWLLESETNTFAKEQVERYQIRPKEEFYVLDDDAYEMKNQINNIKYQKDIDRLRRTLYNWMLEQGDKGQETELKARERM
ncbi:MAG: sulfatase-like hydrolase/transferase, partial [Rikenellaceae bacterium]